VNDLDIVLAALFVCAAGLNALANRLDVPYPILLVLGGLALGLVPGVPDLRLDPNLVLLVFLPPLLYSAAFFADLRALRNDARVISLNAIGLVLATTAAVAVAAHAAADLPWAMSFALGAIVAPTDPVAATTIMRRVGAPRRMINVIEGESLFNDATALVTLKVAVAAAVGESVSAGHVVGLFFLDAAGGVAVGLVVGWVIAQIRRRVTDVNTELTISLVSGYGAFIPADLLGLSGVLAVVTCGVYLGFQAPKIASLESRMQSEGLWSMITFLINAALFILIGVQLPAIVGDLHDRTLASAIGIAAIVCVTVIGMRYLWSFTITALIRTLDRRPSQRARRIGWQARVVAGWAGMRGAVSLAAALSLPLMTHDHSPLPGRALIQFVTFALILVTVVGQGLTLPALIHRLGVTDDDDGEQREELRARLAIARAALDRLDALSGEDWPREQSIERARRLYEYRLRRFKTRAGKIPDDDGIETGSMLYQRMMHEVFDAQREALLSLRDSREISTDVMRHIERELDLEEARLEV
jgi:CPA1 family monovalent cation:H+ antiporter